MNTSVTLKKPLEIRVATEEEIVPLILDGISQILDNGHNMPRNYNELPLSIDEVAFLVEVLHKDLQDPGLPGALIYLYGKILDYLHEITIYN
jgi:hypothetical protein